MLPPLDQWDEVRHPLYFERAELLKYDIQYCSSSLTGRVKSGRLWLKAPMFRAQIESMWTEVSDCYGTRPTPVTACSIGDAVLHVFPDYPDILTGKPLYFVFIHRTHGLDRIIGIILERAFIVGLYKRVGYFQFDRSVNPRKQHQSKGEGQGLENLEAFRKLWDVYSKSKERGEYIRWHKDGAEISVI